MRRWRSGALLAGAILASVAVAAASAASLVGTKSPDLLRGTKGADTLKGKAGGDTVKGKAGPDLLYGGKGDDLLVGGPGADRIFGGPGADRIKASDGRADRAINGGGGANACVLDIPLDLAVSSNCASIQQGPDIPGASPKADGSTLEVTSAQGLLCPPAGGCVFTITGKGADALVGTVTGGGAVTSVVNVAVNGVVTGTWVATGTYTCAAGEGDGYLVVTIGSKSTPQIPVNC